MLQTAFAILFTALLSAVLTWLLALLWYRHQLRAALDARIGQVEAELERRVHAGVLAAGVELLPQLREQVRLGFTDALKSSEAAGLMENAASVVNLGTDIVAGSLGALLGVRRK